MDENPESNSQPLVLVNGLKAKAEELTVHS